MSNLTPELALGTAVGPDDTANYLTITLASALNTIDGEFSSATGHNHNGAHQGGVLHFSNLLTSMITFDNGATLGPFATGNQLRFQSTNVSFSGNATVDGTLTAATGTITTLNVSGATTVGALTVNGPISATAATTLNQLTVTGLSSLATVTTSGRITSGTDMLITNGTLYLHPSGDTVIIRAAPGVVNMQGMNATSIAVSGATVLQGSASVPNNDLLVRGLGVVRSPRADGRKIDFGSVVATSLISNGAVGQTVNFNQAFTANPEVLVAVSDVSGGGGTLDRIGVGRSAITTTSFQLTIKNGDPSTQTIFANWIAIGN